MAPCEGNADEGAAGGAKAPSGCEERGPLVGTSTGAFRRYPTDRDVFMKSYYTWMKGKRIDDDIGPYWRVHDKLYDLTEFAHIHPGGKDWIDCTKGTDVTEAFESSHLGTTPEKLLSQYIVRDISTPRNSPYTFSENGFYKTLKRKAHPILRKSGRGPTLGMILIQDGLALTFVALIVETSIFESYLLALLSGIVLGLCCGCGHNFIHQKDSFRRFSVDLTFISSYEWRVTHIISHHIYPNTLYDYETSEYEPFWVFMPRDKWFFQRFGVPFYEWILIPWALYFGFLKRLYLWISGKTKPRAENCLPFLQLLVMVLFAPSVVVGISLWMTIHCACSTWMVIFSLAGNHHHPDIYHEGDAPRNDPDWGLCQLDAVRDKIGFVGNLFVVATSFGNHGLHHLFPTVDHSRLNQLYPVFYETCQHFNINYEFLSQWEVLRGKYVQLAKVSPNAHPPGS